MDLYSAEVVEYIKDIQSIYTKINEGKNAEKDFISHLYSIGIPSTEIENKINKSCQVYIQIVLIC